MIIDIPISHGFKEVKHSYIYTFILYWPPHLLSGPQMLNSEGPTGPQVKEL